METYLNNHFGISDLSKKGCVQLLYSGIVLWCVCFILTSHLFVFQVLSFFQGLFTFYHQGYELAKDFNHYKMALQINIQNVS